MRKVHYLFGWMCLIFPLISFSASKTILCEPPQGTRVDYFLFNHINLQNQTFLMGKDRVAGMKPKIILLDDNNVTFVISDSEEVKSNEKAGNMKILQRTDDQISFTGLINHAPVLATYYPKIGILIYSQQSTWSGPEYKGARAVIFYSKCDT